MKKMLNFILFGLLALSVVSCGNQQTSNSSTSSEAKEKIVVGLECNYAPFNWTENSKTNSNYPIDGAVSYAEGYDVQIAKIIAEELNMELVIKKIEWDGLIPSVQTGVIDLIIAGMSPTSARLIDIDFTSPYYTSEHVLLVESNGTYANITDISELSGARISGQIGTLYDDIAHAIPNADTGKQYDKKTVPEIVSDLQAGRIDGTVLELPVAQGLASANPSLKMIRFETGHGFTQLIDEETNELRDIVDTDRDVSIGLAKNRDELKNSINSILESITIDRRNDLMTEAVNNQAA